MGDSKALKCRHAKGPGSTLHTVFTSEVDGWRFWYCYCHVCDNVTHLCLTPNEAVMRAERDWFTRKAVLA